MTGPTAYLGPFPARTGMTLDVVDRHERVIRAAKLPPAQSNRACYLCGSPGILGCEHFAPMEIGS